MTSHSTVIGTKGTPATNFGTSPILYQGEAFRLMTFDLHDWGLATTGGQCDWREACCSHNGTRTEPVLCKVIDSVSYSTEYQHKKCQAASFGPAYVTGRNPGNQIGLCPQHHFHQDSAKSWC